MIDVTPEGKKVRVSPAPVKKGKYSNPFFKGVTKKNTFMADLENFAHSWTQRKYQQIVSLVEAEGTAAVNPIPGLGAGQGERLMMQKYGWYWEPLLHDVQFYQEMRDSIALIDGSVQKFIDIVLEGFHLQCDPEFETDLEAALLKNPDVNFRETLRACAIDAFSLGNAYRIPIWKRDDKGRLVPKTFKPVRVDAMRKLRDQDLVVEGYVQLLHRPSEFIAIGPKPPEIPTIWLKDEVICGEMRTYGWYAYGKPLCASLPFILRLKLTMERDLAEMLHQHVPRIDITFTPDEQLNQDQVDDATSDLKSQVSELKTTDNFVHTPDVLWEYKGPESKGLDFESPQKHTEDQLFYVLPFAQAMLGLDSQANPFDSQQHWTVTSAIAESVRESMQVMFAPIFAAIQKDWGIEDPITMAFSDLNPQNTLANAQADEQNTNTAKLKVAAGFIDQDTGAKLATANHKNGPVKKAAAPGPLPPPLDPNKAVQPGDGSNPPKPSSQKDPARVDPKGPAKDGTKTPAPDRRPKGKRHAFTDQVEAALSELWA